MEPVPFSPDRFRTAASHYTAGRPPYSPHLIDALVATLELRPGARVLDLGCGPAPLGIVLAQRGFTVTGVDPSPDMLAEARAAAGRAGVELTLAAGSSYELPDGLDGVGLVVIGRAFHWMDRAATLATLAEIVPPTGAIALFRTRYVPVVENAWADVYHEVHARFAEDDERITAASTNDEDVLAASEFRRLDTLTDTAIHEVPLAQYRDRVLSMSTTSVERIGANAEIAATAVIEALRPFAVEGVIREVVQSSALLARRVG